MKPKISPYHYPTYIALIDDNKAFLDTLSLHLSQSFNCKLFINPVEALEYTDNLYETNRSKTTDLDIEAEDAVFNDILKKQFDSGKYEELSVVVVDYDMSQMNGIEFCAKLKNPNIQKILLTGCASSKEILEALNENIIDYYIDKQTPNLLEKLQNTIHKMQRDYFHNTLSSLGMSLIERKSPYFLDAAVAKFFDETCDQLGVKEYYYMLHPSRFVLLTSDAKFTLIVLTDEEIEQHITILMEEDGPMEWVDKLQSKKYVPHFVSNDGFYTPELQDSSNPMISAITVYGNKNYYCAVLESEDKLGVFNHLETYH